MEISSLESEQLPPAAQSAAKGMLQSTASVVVLDPEWSRRRKPPSSRYKGVVSQPNGRWGAQIYEKHRRVWLGTFSAEAEAAWAYDVAARRFRGCEAAANFDPLAVAKDELSFLNSRSKWEIVDMLRKHTYRDELRQMRNALSAGNRPRTHPSSAAVRRELLFDKSVTPSDVGKLNRLVIPKHHAEKHFPLKRTGGGAVLLNFEDAGGKVWRFRYSYWNSSQSYVLTKGWSRFVKEKGLKPGDVVVFQRSTGDAEHKQLFIACKRRAFQAALPKPSDEVMRLFGIDIVKIPAAATEGSIGKRIDDGELISSIRETMLNKRLIN